MDLFFTVTQVWIDNEGNTGIRGFVYFEEAGQAPAVNRAISKFHEILAHGSISNDKYHASQVIRSDGAIMKEYEYYDRRTEEEPVIEEPAEPANPTEE